MIYYDQAKQTIRVDDNEQEYPVKDISDIYDPKIHKTGVIIFGDTVLDISDLLKKDDDPPSIIDWIEQGNRIERSGGIFDDENDNKRSKWTEITTSSPMELKPQHKYTNNDVVTSINAYSHFDYEEIETYKYPTKIPKRGKRKGSPDLADRQNNKSKHKKARKLAFLARKKKKRK